MSQQCCQGGSLVPASDGKLRCVTCGAIWYRIDPVERSIQGSAGAKKRWAEVNKAKRVKLMQQVRRGGK